MTTFETAIVCLAVPASLVCLRALLVDLYLMPEVLRRARAEVELLEKKIESEGDPFGTRRYIDKLEKKEDAK